MCTAPVTISVLRVWLFNSTVIGSSDPSTKVRKPTATPSCRAIQVRVSGRAMNTRIASGPKWIYSLDDHWESRLLAAVALSFSDAIPVEQRKDVAAHLAAQDPDPVVKLYASAVLELLVRPPATRPATTQSAAGAAATTEPQPPQPPQQP